VSCPGDVPTSWRRCRPTISLARFVRTRLASSSCPWTHARGRASTPRQALGTIAERRFPIRRFQGDPRKETGRSWRCAAGVPMRTVSD